MLERYSLREMADRHGRLYDRLLEKAEPLNQPRREAAAAPISFASRPSRGMPLVSVVTPCFNHGRWLRECVQSVRDQTYPAVEKIVIDDGSTEEDTRRYLDELEGVR
jgi:cellulose synthase/poly-beta-1,6-N-acetylglucosamine synthase-like glycosyltransferase